MLRMRGAGMTPSRLAEAHDATRLQDAVELSKHFLLIQDVMEGIEANDPIDAAIGKLDLMPIEMQEYWFLDIRTSHLHICQYFLADFKHGRRNIDGDGRASELVENTAKPAGAGSEVEDPHRLSQVQAGDDEAKTIERVHRIYQVRKRLGLEHGPVLDILKVLIRSGNELFDAQSRHHLLRRYETWTRLLGKLPRAGLETQEVEISNQPLRRLLEWKPHRL